MAHCRLARTLFDCSLWGSLVLFVALMVAMPAQAQVVVTGNLTVMSGSAPQTWYGLVAVVPGSNSQTISGTLTVAYRPNGGACAQGWECASGFCVNGYCCNSGCNDGCNACNVAGSVGTCTTVPAGTVCRAAESLCQADATCNGVSNTCPTTTGVQPAGTVCRQPRGPCEGVARCDGVSTNCPSAYIPANTVCGYGATCSGSSALCLDGAGKQVGFQALRACQ